MYGEFEKNQGHLSLIGSIIYLSTNDPLRYANVLVIILEKETFQSSLVFPQTVSSCLGKPNPRENSTTIFSKFSERVHGAKTHPLSSDSSTWRTPLEDVNFLTYVGSPTFGRQKSLPQLPCRLITPSLTLYVVVSPTVSDPGISPTSVKHRNLFFSRSISNSTSLFLSLPTR